MASTSLILMSSDKNNNKSIKPSSLQQQHNMMTTTTTTEPSRSIINSRGRKSNNSGKVKKAPQRGMGVAQLESILRDQEKMSHNSGGNNNINNNNNNVNVNVPVQYAPPANHAPLLHPHVMMLNNGNVVIPGGSGQAGFGAPSSPWVFGCPLLEASSRELSSMPNNNFIVPPHHHSSHSHHHHPCDLCYKKKRLTNEEKTNNNNNNNILIGTNARRDTALWSMIHNSPDQFLGFPPNHQAEATDFNIRMSSNNAHPYRYLEEPLGVVAVHRKVGSNMSNGKIVMEYEFFPGKEDAMRGTNFKELGLSLEAKGYEASSYSITAAEEASARAHNNINAHTTTTDDAAPPAPAESKSVDLCLRL